MNLTLPTSGFAEDPGGPPSTAAEVWDTSLKAQRELSNPLARELVLDEEYDRRIRDVKAATGVELFHPRRAAPLPQDYGEAQSEPSRGWTSSISVGAARAAMERRFHRELDKLGEAYPDKADQIRAGATVWDDAYKRVAKAERDAEDATRRSPLSLPVPLLGDVNPVALGASFWGFLHDPINIMTSVIGPGGNAAKGILWNATRQAAAGALQQAAVEPFTQAWRREAGLDFGISQAAFNVAAAGVFGGVVDAGGRSIGRLATGRPLGGTPALDAAPMIDPAAVANDAAPVGSPAEGGLAPTGQPMARALGDPDTALEAAARTLPEDHPIRRMAEGDATASIEVVERLGLSSDDAAVRGALDQMKFEVGQEETVRTALAEAAAADTQLGVVRRMMDAEDRLDAHVAHVAEPEAEPPVLAPFVARVAADAETAAGFSYADPLDGFPMSASDVESIVSMWEYTREMRRQKPPQSLTDFLHSRGGLADDGGDVRNSIGGVKGRPGLVSKRGLTLDDATLLAWQHGFLGSGLERPDVNVLLDALDNDVRGNRVVAELDRVAAEDFVVAQEMEQELDQLGVAGFKTAADVRKHFAKGEGAGRARGGQADIVQALRDGLYQPIEAAALIRERPELAAEVMPTTNIGRGIISLSRLEERAFSRVVDGVLAPEFAAIVADAAPAARHADMIERLAEARPADVAAARRMVAEMLQTATDPATAARILGAADDSVDGVTRADAPVGIRSAQSRERLKAAEFDEPVSEAAKRQADSLKGVEERALDAVTGGSEAPSWMRDLTKDLERADAEANEGMLVAACKLF